jgi:glutaredoxin-like protein
MLPDNVLNELKEQFKELANPVKLIVFTQEIECQFCRENHQLAEAVAGASDKISVETFNFVTDKEMVEKYGIANIPAIAVVSENKDYSIRFIGIPGGYELTSLVEAIKLVSAGDSGLEPATREALKKIDKPVHIQVLVTMTCPYCTQAVKIAHQMALECDNIRADMVEVQEFPHIAHKYSVMGVPKTIVNETINFEGAAPESAFLNAVQQAVEKAD